MLCNSWTLCSENACKQTGECFPTNAQKSHFCAKWTALLLRLPKDLGRKGKKDFDITLVSKVKNWHDKSKKLRYTSLFRMPNNIYKILEVAPSEKQPHLQKFPEGRDLWQPISRLWWMWEKNFCIWGSIYDQLHHLLAVLGQFSLWGEKKPAYWSMQVGRLRVWPATHALFSPVVFP